MVKIPNSSTFDHNIVDYKEAVPLDRACKSAVGIAKGQLLPDPIITAPYTDKEQEPLTSPVNQIILPIVQVPVAFSGDKVTPLMDLTQTATPDIIAAAAAEAAIILPAEPQSVPPDDQTGLSSVDDPPSGTGITG